MSQKDDDDVDVIRFSAKGDSKSGKKKKKKVKKTAHFKKRGHPAFKIMFLVFALLTVLCIIMACVAMVMLVIS